MSRQNYKKRLSKELINEFIYDYKNKVSIKMMVKKYNRAWTTLYGYIKEKGIKPIFYHSHRNVYEQKPAQETIDYDKVIRGKTLREWQKYNTEINKKYIRGYDLL